MYTLQHHGVKGMKWGVRNGPPYPLKSSARSSAERKAINRVRKAAKTKSKVDSIVDSLSMKEKELLGMSVNDINYLTIEQGEHVIHRELKEIGNLPVSFFDMLDDGETINLAMATRHGDEYRGKGYASEQAQNAMKWLEKHPKERDGRDVVWGVKEENGASIAIAKKMGFKEDPDSHNNGWVNYIHRIK